MSKLPPTLSDQIQALGYEQVHELYHLVWERLNFLRRAKSLVTMKHLNLYDRVSFDHQGKRYYGSIERINQKTVSVIEDSTGIRWRISRICVKSCGQ